MEFVSQNQYTQVRRGNIYWAAASGIASGVATAITTEYYSNYS